MATLKERIIELIQAGNIDSAKAELNLLQDGLIDEEGNTLYHEAVSRQDVLLLSWLLTNYQSTLSPNTPNNSGTTCFHIACRQGKTASFMALWNGSKVQQKLLCQKADSDGHTALHMACLEGQLSVAREIASKVKEAAFATNKKKQTALHIAAAGGHTSCVRLLTQFKKLIDALDSFDATALHYAVNGGHLVTAKYLLERCHAKSNFMTTSQMNIAHAAVASGDFNMVKYIFHKTKERTHVMITSTGASVLHIAAGMGYENILEFLLVQPYIYQYVNIQEKNGWSAAHLAALRNRAGCLAILIGFGADIHSNKDKNRMSVYQIMCYNETSDMRRTFPQLFEQLDFARGNRQTRARHRSPPKSRSSNYVINDSSIAQQNGDKTNRKSASKRTSSLNASYIVKSQMDFTKTNPIAEDSTPGLKQRSRCPKKPHTLQIIMV